MTAGPTRFGRYVLIEPLGRGGMAEVWRARVEGGAGFARDVVIKRMLAAGEHADADLVAMFAREAKVLSLLRHANIIQVLDYGDVDGEPFLAMEYVEGLDLSRLLARARKRDETLAPGIAAYVVREMARALKHVHEAVGEDGQPLGLVHRDVSPSNVLASLDGSVKLLDFGIAKSRADRLLTGMGAFRGKLGYSAPEVVEGQPHEPRSDLFALGVVLHEMLTGRRLFDAPSDAETYALVRAASVVAPSEVVPGVPPSLDAVCLTALSRLPGDRYESAQAFLSAIDPVVHELQTGPEQLAALVASYVEPDERARRNSSGSFPAVPMSSVPPRRLAVGLIAGGVAVALLAGVATFFVLSRRPEPVPVVVVPPVAVPPPVAVDETPAPVRAHVADSGGHDVETSQAGQPPPKRAAASKKARGAKVDLKKGGTVDPFR
ncbi:MAG: serine/threonine protein kinase [Myxococcaceae bacterium]|nr:serine/threonine protein kinase [Myxococcaceae bacterium]